MGKVFVETYIFIEIQKTYKKLFYYKYLEPHFFEIHLHQNIDGTSTRTCKCIANSAQTSFFYEIEMLVHIIHRMAHKKQDETRSESVVRWNPS